jgi:hypothetical protein
MNFSKPTKNGLTLIKMNKNLDLLYKPISVTPDTAPFTQPKTFIFFLFHFLS